MAIIGAVNPGAVNAANSCSQQEYPPALEDAEAPQFIDSQSEASPRSPSWGRRAVVVVMGMVVAGVALTVIGATFMQGTWWYSYPGDQALDHEFRVRLEALRDEVDANGAVPQVVTWLNAALDPNTDPTAVRNYLLTAQEALRATADPRLVEVASELQVILRAVRPVSPSEVITPCPIPTIEWPGGG
jgi:hypothetical protein